MSTFFQILAVVLFLIAGIVIIAGGSIGVAPLALISFGLASHAVAHLPIDRP